MKPIVAAEAPAIPRYAPMMLAAPSWVISENRLTTPISSIKAKAVFFTFFSSSIIQVIILLMMLIVY